jgi:hypothetical protein
MTTRRTVIQAGAMIAAAATPVLSLSAFTAPEGQAAPSGPALQYYRVAYDGRIAGAASFGAAARSLGACVHDIDGNMTALWYHELQPRWQHSPAAVAGMTRFSALLGLQMMASAAGLRVIYRGNHHLESPATVHGLFGSAAVLSGRTALPSAAGAWPAEVAGIVMSWPRTALAIDRAHSNILDADRRAVGPDALVSWILAPARRV